MPIQGVLPIMDFPWEETSACSNHLPLTRGSVKAETARSTLGTGRAHHRLGRGGPRALEADSDPRAGQRIARPGRSRSDPILAGGPGAA